jgi:hypothetical protein
LQDLVRLRGELLDIQVNADPLAPMSTEERIRQIIMQPFMAAPAHYEVAGWADAVAITEEINRYMASPLSGLQFGPLFGGVLTLFVLVGLVALGRRGWTFRLGIFVWLLLTLALLMVNPLPWQRYYLPLIPLTTLLAGIGIYRVLALFVHRPEQESHLSSTAIAPKL